jgi:hypothetical protein
VNDPGNRSVRPLAQLKTTMPQIIGGLICLCLLFGRSLADPACSLTELANLPASFNGAAVVEVSINGSPAKFRLNTASAFTKISRSFANRLNLPILVDREKVNNARGTNRRDGARISEIKIGQVVGHSSTLLVMEGGGDGATDEIAGEIGLDYLDHIDIELDPAEKRVHLFKQLDCPAQSAYWSSDHFELPVTLPGQLPVVRIAIDGKELDAHINTAMAHSHVSYGAAKFDLDLPDSVDVPPPSNIPDGGERRDNPTYIFKELAFGPVTIRNPKIEIIRFAALETQGATHIKTTFATDTPVSIGMDVLGKFHSMISLGNGKIYFTLPNERNQPAAVAAKP